MNKPGIFFFFSPVFTSVVWFLRSGLHHHGLVVAGRRLSEWIAQWILLLVHFPYLGRPHYVSSSTEVILFCFGPVFFTIETSRPRNHFHSLLQCRMNITDNAAMVKDGSKKMKKKRKRGGDITLAPLAFPDHILLQIRFSHRIYNGRGDSSLSSLLLAVSVSFPAAQNSLGNKNSDVNSVNLLTEK